MGGGRVWRLDATGVTVIMYKGRFCVDDLMKKRGSTFLGFEVCLGNDNPLPKKFNVSGRFF